MSRPRSIAIFEIAYLGALAINIAGPLLIWQALTASVAEQAQAGPDAGGMVNGVLIGGLVVVAALGLLLWWLVARLGSNVARWIVAVLLACSLVSAARDLAQFGVALAMMPLLSLLGMVFTAVAIASLFMRDARAWFAAEPEELS